MTGYSQLRHDLILGQELGREGNQPIFRVSARDYCNDDYFNEVRCDNERPRWYASHHSHCRWFLIWPTYVTSVVANVKNQIQSFPRRLLDPRRPKQKPTAEEQEEMLFQYDPLIPDDPRRVLSHTYEVRLW